MSWQENAIMYWSSDDGATWHKVTDHNSDPLAITFERFEKRDRMVDATLRRYSIAKKRSFSTSWSMIPSKVTPGGGHMGTVDSGWAGEDIEAFHNTVDGAFKMKLRKGQDEAKAITDGTIEVVDVMITDYSRDVEMRGKLVDFWTVSITLEEV